MPSHAYNKLHQLTGAQKSAIVFLCLGEERGGKLMQELDVAEIHTITDAISNMGEVRAELVEDIMEEFGEKVSEYGAVTGSVAAARGLLKEFLPEERVTEILEEIKGGASGDVWADLSSLDEKALLDIILPEQNQTVAVILARISPAAAAKVLPLLGTDRAADLLERMMVLDELPRSTVKNIEDSLRREVVSKSSKDASALVANQLVSVFNKLDKNDFAGIARELEQRAPDRFLPLKQRMFIFDDLVKLPPNMLAKVMREGGGDTLPLALRGASKEVRDEFLQALPSRSRDMLSEEMANMGPVKTKDVRAAQSELVEAAMRLSDAGDIDLPSDDEEEMIA